jgi:omega-hydroxy-beta-dihydromenaquinone-9 sulfotransferase
MLGDPTPRSDMAASPAHPGRETQPIFIVGCGRSGTTLLYETLARHRDAAWFSTWTERTELPELALFNRMYKRGWHSRRYGPRPAEGHRLWHAALGLPEGGGGALAEEHATPGIAARVHRLVARHCRFGAGPVFLNKNTGNSRRVPLLSALYPGGRFIHVLRFPLDTISSLLEVEWWRDLPLWPRDGATPRSLCDGPIDEARLAAELWVREVSAARGAGRRLDADQYIEIRYEELARSPLPVLAMLLDRLGLDPVDAMGGRFIPEVSDNAIGSYRNRLSPEQARAAWATTEELASQLNYSDP